MCFYQGDGVPEDRLKAHELFQAWEEQCACEAAGLADPGIGEDNFDTPRSTPASTSLPCRVRPENEDDSTQQSVREGAALRTQVVE
jgi:hypothetical protein